MGRADAARGGEEADPGGTGWAPAVAEPPEILSEPGSFAWTVMHERHPALIAQIRDAYPYGPRELAGLDALLDEIRAGTVLPLPDDAHDKAAWDARGRGYIGLDWTHTPFLWAESFFYAKLLHAVGYWSAGPWRGIDPFEFLKTAELRAPALASDLAALDELGTVPGNDLTAVLLEASLWGNRADLGFRIGVAAAHAGTPGISRDGSSDLVADQTPALLDAFGSGRVRRLAIIADNAGRELTADLVLIDRLLGTARVDEIELHVKPHPYYVSDATTADVVHCLRRLGEVDDGPSSERAGTAGPRPAAVEVATRLRAAFHEGRLRLAAHAFFCAPYPFHRMPPDLRADLASCDLVLVKGDLNYRRLVDDRRWPPTTAFADTVTYFPAPVAALRTLKSDVVVGLDAGTVAALDASGERWRTNGARGLVQVRS